MEFTRIICDLLFQPTLPKGSDIVEGRGSAGDIEFQPTLPKGSDTSRY